MQMEKMLCSLASPCFLMWVSKGGQYKTHGNVITFSQDLNNLCMSLPCLPEELNVLIIWKPGTRDSSTYKDFCVWKSKVLCLLHFLKEHNPYYSHIIIQPSEDIDLPDDGNILNRLPHTMSPSEPSKLPVSEPSDPVKDLVDTVADSLGTDFILDELAQEQNMFMPGIAPGPSKLDVICIGMWDRNLDWLIGCYDTAHRLQLCLFFHSYHVSPFPPRVACHPCAWPQWTTCDLASHDWQTGPLACGACQRVSGYDTITVPPPTLTYGPLRLCQRMSQLTDRDWVGP